MESEGQGRTKELFVLGGNGEGVGNGREKVWGGRLTWPSQRLLIAQLPMRRICWLSLCRWMHCTSGRSASASFCVDKI